VQLVQNADVRLFTDAQWCDDVIRLLRQLHWLPVRQRIIFKIVVLVHESRRLHTSLMTVVTCQISVIDQCTLAPMTSKCCLCNAHTTDLETEASWLLPAFLFPRLWNDDLTFAVFMQKLKTHLFGFGCCSDRGA